MHERFKVIAFAITLWPLVVSSPALAATLPLASGSVLTTSPVSQDLTGIPGSTVSTILEVQNDGAQPVNISIKLEEFKSKGTAGEAQLFEPSSNDPSISWVHFSVTSLTAQPHVWNPVTMTVSLPKTAAFGYYYAVLFIPNVTTSAPAANVVKGANAILILVDAYTPNEHRTLALQNFSISKRSVQYLPVTFSISVQNTGNVFAIPAGNIYISRSANGPTIDTLELNSGDGNILPATNRVFTVDWNNGSPVYDFVRDNGQIVSNQNGTPKRHLVWNFSQLGEISIWGILCTLGYGL